MLKDKVKKKRERDILNSRIWVVEYGNNIIMGFQNRDHE